MLENEIIGFIGGGNMATALIGGLLDAGMDSKAIVVSEPDDERRQLLARQFPVRLASHNQQVGREASVCVLAVKPQVLADVTRELRETLITSGPMLISIAAGISISNLERWSDPQLSIVRVMPNTPSLVGCGASALYGNDRVTDHQKQIAQTVTNAVGLSVWLERESEIDTVTALSGSGPAYFFLMMEALVDAAMEEGLTESTARKLCLQTGLGAARLASDSEQSLQRLRLNVTSPGGTTEQGVRALEENHFRGALRSAIKAAKSRSIKLEQELGQ